MKKHLKIPENFNRIRKQGFRFWSLVLSFVLLILAFPVRGISIKTNASESSDLRELMVYSEGSPVSSLMLEKNRKQVLTAAGLPEDAEYQWQIRMPGTESTWIDIYNMRGNTCELSYALLGSLLDANGQTAVRCSAFLDGVQYISNFVYVTISYCISKSTGASDAVSCLPVSAGTGNPKLQSTQIPPALNDAGDGESENVTIKIYYKIVQEGQESDVFDPYVANLRKGSSFSAIVPSPMYVGYTPVYNKEGEEYEDASNVVLNYKDLQQSEEVYIWYRPVLVTYCSRYFLQNVLNDLYTEDTSLMVVGEALTGDYPSEKIDIEIEGFTALFHEPDTVAADGSTEFNCYYDRNFYLYYFDCDGGYGVDPVYARYGTSLLVNNPTRTGYIFKGWDKMEEDGTYDGVADTLPSAIGIGNENYKALWETAEASFTVIYWGQNANDNSYSYITSATYETTSGMRLRSTDLDSFKLTSKEGETYPGDKHLPIPYYAEADYFTYNEEATVANNPMHEELDQQGNLVECMHVEGDGSTVVNVVYTRKVYTLKFFYAKSQAGLNGNTEYYVVGGSTYYFGNANTDDEQTMLEAENSRSEVWGRVTELPQLNANGQSRTYTLGSETYNGVTYYYLSFEARYGSDISGLWPVAIFQPVMRTSANTHGNWSGMEAYRSGWNAENHVKYTQDHPNNQTIKGIYQKLDSTILYDSRYEDSSTVRYLCFWENGADISWSVPKLFIYELYVPASEDEGADLIYRGVRYKAYIPPFNTYDDSNFASQTPSALEGFKFLRQNNITNGRTSEGMESYTVQFFYTRNTYTLDFYDYNEVAREYKNVPYETPLKNYNFVPEYPSGLEAGAYEFDGWYPAPNGQGTRIDLETTGLRMPASDTTLYAYWKPVENTVTFSHTYDEMVDGIYISEEIVEHGEYLPTSAVPEPSSASLGEGTYIFQGWFYIDDVTGEKKAFDTGRMPIKGGMHFFAEWQSSEVVSYTIHYRYTDAGGSTVTIGTDTTGYSYAGMTKTFTAKAGTELTSGYQSNYYPSTNSHSLLMGKSAAGNVYTFEYVHKDSVTYTVKYLDKVTGAELRPAEIHHTSDSVVTEQFAVINGYVPDAYYKRLVLSADESQNVIAFYYTRDVTHSIYVVKHMVEELDGTYTEYASIEGIGDLGNELPVQSPMSIIGLSYDVEKTREENGWDITVSDDGVTGILGEDGLEMFIYYSRSEYDYTVNYLEYGTNQSLQASVTGRGKYGSVVTVSVSGGQIPDPITTADGTAYYLMGEKSRTIYIREGAVLNIYYQAKSVSINYIAVCNYPNAKNYGSVSPISETVTSIQNISGSTPTAEAGYRFAGWYTDAACTLPADNDWVDGTTGKLEPKDLSQNLVYYYALFERKTAVLTLNKAVGGSYGDLDDEFRFTITLDDDKYSGSVGVIAVVSAAAAGVEIPAYRELNFEENSQAVVKLKHGQSVSLSIPEGCSYHIEEDTGKGYAVSIHAPAGVTVNGSQAEGTADGDVSITFKNTRNVVPTGIRLDILPYLLIAGTALAAGILFAVRKRAAYRQISRRR